jgi:hypothetical protein
MAWDPHQPYFNPDGSQVVQLHKSRTTVTRLHFDVTIPPGLNQDFWPSGTPYPNVFVEFADDPAAICAGLNRLRPDTGYSRGEPQPTLVHVSGSYAPNDNYGLKAEIASLMMAKTLGTEVEAVIDDHCRLVAISFL